MAASNAGIRVIAQMILRTPVWQWRLPSLDPWDRAVEVGPCVACQLRRRQLSTCARHDDNILRLSLPDKLGDAGEVERADDRLLRRR